ncbi:MAG: fumarylacetoacetate hydrolase family protein, partial [Variovorax sp.]
GSRDGQLVVVSRDLTLAHYATGMASRLQQVLDDWGFLSPQLESLYEALNAGQARHPFPFDPTQCLAPLPRAYQWAEGRAYAQSARATLEARPDEASPHTSGPRLTRGCAGQLLGPLDAIELAPDATDIDFGAGLAVITGDVRAGATPEQALEGIRLVMLVNAMTLADVLPSSVTEISPAPRRPATAFSPVAVTPDELGDAWQAGRVHLTLQVHWNARKVGLCPTGPDMSFHFGQLMARLAANQPIGAGCLVASGPVGNHAVAQAETLSWPGGYASIAEKRAIEIIQTGQAATAFMQFGDTVRIEMKGLDGRPMFGAIEQRLAQQRVPTASKRPR